MPRLLFLYPRVVAPGIKGRAPRQGFNQFPLRLNLEIELAFLDLQSRDPLFRLSSAPLVPGDEVLENLFCFLLTKRGAK